MGQCSTQTNISPTLPIYTELNSAKPFPKHSLYIYSAILEPIQTKPTKAKLNHPFKLLEAIQANSNKPFRLLEAIQTKPSKVKPNQTKPNKPLRPLEAIKTKPNQI